MYAEALTLVLTKVLTSINKNLEDILNNCLVKIAIATITSIKIFLIFIDKILKVNILNG